MPGSAHHGDPQDRAGWGGLFLWLTALAALPFAAGCSPAPKPFPAASVAPSATVVAVPTTSPTSVPKRGGTLRVPLSSDGPFLDPHLTLSYGTHEAVALSYGKLIRPKVGADVGFAAFIPEGDLAERWEQRDATTYVFFLRKGVKFHPVPRVGGRELVAEDVVFSFNRARFSAEGKFGPVLSNIESVDATDRYTVRFRLREPDASFLYRLGDDPSVFILPKELVAEYGDGKKDVVGTGPYMVEKYEKGSSLVLQKYEGYMRPGLPYIERIDRPVVPDYLNRLALFLTGRADVLSGVGNSLELKRELDEVLSILPDTRWQKVPGPMRVLALRADGAPFSDVRVRRAVSMALDRREIIGKVHSGEASWSAAVPPGLEGWSLPEEQWDEATSFMRYDLEGARALLREAGHEAGIEITAVVSRDLGFVYTAEVQLMQEQLARAGIRLHLEDRPYTLWLSYAVEQGFFSEMTVFPSGLSMNPDTYLYDGFHSQGRLNYTRLDDPLLDQFLEVQRRTPDTRARQALVLDIQRYLLKEQYSPPLVADWRYAVWRPNVKGYAPHAGYGDWGLVSSWMEK